MRYDYNHWKATSFRMEVHSCECLTSISPYASNLQSVFERLISFWCQQAMQKAGTIKLPMSCLAFTSSSSASKYPVKCTVAWSNVGGSCTIHNQCAFAGLHYSIIPWECSKTIAFSICTDRLMIFPVGSSIFFREYQTAQLLTTKLWTKNDHEQT